jgi:Ca2+-binding RTX toxin-like protein
VGGAGSDTITGGNGCDILIGSGGADMLNAGSGGDILMSGKTVYNANLIALLAVMAEWGRTDLDARGRVHHLFGDTSGGKNGSFLLDYASVLPSTAVSKLYGGPARIGSASASAISLATTPAARRSRRSDDAGGHGGGPGRLIVGS